MATDKQSRLKSVLETYGADPARWPDADRSDLAGLLTEQASAPSEFAEAREVDQILAAASQPVPPPGAASRLADIVRATPQNIRSQGAADPVHVLGIGKFATVAILAASLMFGVYVGTLDTIEFDPFANEEEDVASLFEDPFGFESLEEEGGEGSG